VLGVDEVAAYTEIHNRRSRAVMERLGMSFVGEVRATGLVEGKDGVHDDARFALYSIRGRSAAPS
jgi:RimJ/RimL family protein N-acetyltransferase